jgi:hypothetical protein
LQLRPIEAVNQNKPIPPSSVWTDSLSRAISLAIFRTRRFSNLIKRAARLYYPIEGLRADTWFLKADKQELNKYAACPLHASIHAELERYANWSSLTLIVFTADPVEPLVVTSPQCQLMESETSPTGRYKPVVIFLSHSELNGFEALHPSTLDLPSNVLPALFENPPKNSNPSDLLQTSCNCSTLRQRFACNVDDEKDVLSVPVMNNRHEEDAVGILTRGEVKVKQGKFPVCIFSSKVFSH